MSRHTLAPETESPQGSKYIQLINQHRSSVLRQIVKSQHFDSVDTTDLESQQLNMHSLHTLLSRAKPLQTNSALCNHGDPLRISAWAEICQPSHQTQTYRGEREQKGSGLFVISKVTSERTCMLDIRFGLLKSRNAAELNKRGHD